MKPITNHADDITTYWVLRDSTTHAPKTSVTITDIDTYYIEEGAAISSKVDLTALAAADSAHADGKGFEIGQGVYRIDFEDAAFDGGVGKSVILVVVCSGVDTAYREIILSPSANVVAAGGTTVTAGDFVADVAATHVHAAAADTKTASLTYTVANKIDANVYTWNGTAVSAPATAGIPEVNVKNINNVATTSVTTVNANQGTTQPVNFTGTGASAYAKADMVDIAGAAVSTTTAQIGANVVQISGDATAADNCELAFDTTGYGFTGCTMPTTTAVTNDVGITQAGADKVWGTAARTITALDEDSVTLDLDATIAGAVWNAAITSYGTSGTYGEAAEAVTTELAKVPKSDSTVSWNATALAAIQSEANDALIANNLDHLCLTATAGVDMTTEVADGTIISRIISNSDTSLFVPATSNLTTLGANVTTVDDYLDTELAAITAAVITNAAGADVATDVVALQATVDALATTADVTAAILDHDVTAHTTASTVGKYVNDVYAGVVTNATGTDVGSDTTSLITELAKVPKSDSTVSWNSTALAAIQSECTDALNAYDPPTKTELDSGFAALASDADIADAVWNETSTGHTTAGYAGAQLWTDIDAILEDTGTTLDTKINTIDDFLDTEVAAILADTNELQTDWVNGGRLDVLLDTAAAGGDQWNTSLPGAYSAGTAGYILGTNLAAIYGDTEKAAIDLLDDANGLVDIHDTVAATAAHITADYGANQKAAIDLLDDADGGLADIHSVVNAIVADTNELQTDWANDGRLDLLLDNASSAGDPWDTAIPGSYASGKAGYILGTNLAAIYGSTEKTNIGYIDEIKTVTDALPTLATAVDAIWDEDVESNHQTSGTSGKKLDDAGAGADPWTVALPGSYSAGQAGKIVGDYVNAPIGTVDTVVDGIATTLGSAGAGLTAIPWNAAWDTEVQSEATDALNAYDPPTKAEMDSAIDAVPTAEENVAALLDHDYTAHTTANTMGKWLNAVRTLIGHKSVENEEGTSVSYKATDDSTESGTMSWDETGKTRGRYTGW